MHFEFLEGLPQYFDLNAHQRLSKKIDGLQYLKTLHVGMVQKLQSGRDRLLGRIDDGGRSFQRLLL